MERAAGAGGFFEGVGVMGSDECQAAVPNLDPLTGSAESLSLKRLGRRQRRARAQSPPALCAGRCSGPYRLRRGPRCVRRRALSVL